MTTGSDAFSRFDISRSLIEPTLRALGSGNGAFDALFYDVNTMVTDLFLHGSILVKGAAVSLSPRFSKMSKSFSQLDLSASSNPAGSILVVDAGRPPSITQFADVASFIRWVDAHGQTLRTASVTGVGSSALGSAAFAWNLSTALEEPVAAIVSGNGAADAMQQGLDGMFEVYNLWMKQIARDFLAYTNPLAARSGSLPSLPTNCALSAKALHVILRDVPNISRVFGHSKGGVAIKNAMQTLPPEMTQRLHVVTFGWPMPEDIPTAGYSQFLGRLDGLGLVNSWGSPPPTLIPTHHGTNTSIPLSMPVSILARLAMIEQGIAPTRDHKPADRGAQVTAIHQRKPVARHWNEEDTEALLARSRSTRVHMSTPPNDADELVSPGRASRTAGPRKVALFPKSPQARGGQHD